MHDTSFLLLVLFIIHHTTTKVNCFVGTNKIHTNAEIKWGHARAMRHALWKTFSNEHNGLIAQPNTNPLCFNEEKSTVNSNYLPKDLNKTIQSIS